MKILEDKTAVDGFGSAVCTKIQVKDKHVESLWFPRLDEGSIPSGSTDMTAPWQPEMTKAPDSFPGSLVPFLGIMDKKGLMKPYQML